MSEGQPLEDASNPPREVPDILSFESEQERLPEPASDPPAEEVPRSDMLSFENEQELSPEPWMQDLQAVREHFERVREEREREEREQRELREKRERELRELRERREREVRERREREEREREEREREERELREQRVREQRELRVREQRELREQRVLRVRELREQRVLRELRETWCSPCYEALSSFMLFLSETWSMVTEANEITRGCLFLSTNGVVLHQLASVNSLTFEKRNELSFGEAFNMSLPQMVHISMILLSFAVNFVLLFRVYPGIHCVVLLFCLLMPLYYFAELAHKAAGIAVNLGSGKMPLIWFSTLGGLGISLIGGSMVLLIVFLSWLYARRRGLEFQGIGVNGDSIIGAMNA